MRWENFLQFFRVEKLFQTPLACLLFPSECRQQPEHGMIRFFRPWWYLFLQSDAHPLNSQSRTLESAANGIEYSKEVSWFDADSAYSKTPALGIADWSPICDSSQTGSFEPLFLHFFLRKKYSFDFFRIFSISGITPSGKYAFFFLVKNSITLCTFSDSFFIKVASLG